MRQEGPGTEPSVLWKEAGDEMTVCLPWSQEQPKLSDPSGPALPVAADHAVRQPRTLLTLQAWGASLQGQGSSTWTAG